MQSVCHLCYISSMFSLCHPLQSRPQNFHYVLLCCMKTKSMHWWFELFTWCINLLEYESSPFEIQQYEQYSSFVTFRNFSLHSGKQKKSQAGLFRGCLWKTCPIFCVITVFWHKLSISQSVQPPSSSYFWPLLEAQFFSVF